MRTETDESRSRSALRTAHSRLRGSPTSAAISLIVCDEDPRLRRWLVAQVDAYPDVRVVATEDSEEAALRRIRETRPRVLLVRAGLDDNHSRRFIARVREAGPEVKILVMDLAPGHNDAAEFVKAGVSGFLMQDATADEVIDAVRSVAAGQAVLPFELVGALLDRLANHSVAPRPLSETLRAERITQREWEVADLIAEGLSNKEIGRRLHVGTHTVKSHVHNILDKLSLRTRLEIASFDWTQPDSGRRADLATCRSENRDSLVSST